MKYQTNTQIFYPFFLFFLCPFSFPSDIVAQDNERNFSQIPYKIKIYLSEGNQGSDGVAPTNQVRSEHLLGQALVERAKALMGVFGEIQVEFPENPEFASFRSLLTDKRSQTEGRLPVSVDSAKDHSVPLPESWEKVDKVFLMALSADKTLLFAREYDVKTRWPGNEATYRIEHPSKQIDTFMDALFDLFSPVAKIEKSSGSVATLRLQGSGLYSPIISPSHGDSEKAKKFAGVPVPGGVLLPFVRVLDHDNNQISVSPIFWTALYTEELDVSTAVLRCRVESGLRNPLSVRRRGRTEIYALSVPTPMIATTLQLQSRIKGNDLLKTLSTYEVFEVLPGQDRPLTIGNTLSDGTFLLMPHESRPIRKIMIKSGRSVIAQVPIVRGLETSCLLSIPDDVVRLEAEGVLMGIQEEYIDVKARREILKKRRDKFEQEKDDKRFQDTRNELMRLKPNERFLIDVQQARLRYRSEDPLIQRRIDKMFNETENAIKGKFF